MTSKWINFSIDYRSLRLFRAFLGILLFLDSLQRSFVAREFYGDRGILPRWILKSVGVLPTASPFFWSGRSEWIIFLFATMGILGLLLVADLHPRRVSLALLVFVISMQNRNPIVVYGVDTLERVMLIWSVLLPSGVEEGETQLSNWVSFGVLVQLAMIYIFAGWWKSSAVYFFDATAAFHTLSLETFARPWAHGLLSFPLLLRNSSRGIFLLERFGWILFFLPWRRPLARISAFGLFTCMHAALGFCLYLGLFPLFDIAFLALLIPSEFWMWWESTVPWTFSLLRRRFRWKRATEIFALVLLAWFLAVNSFQLAGLDPKHAQWKTSARELGLWQNWGFFAPYPASDEWLVSIDGRDRAGTQVNLDPIYHGSIFSDEELWIKLEDRFGVGHAGSLEKSLAAYLCRSWNAENKVPIGEVRLIARKHWLSDKFEYFTPPTVIADYRMNGRCRPHAMLTNRRKTL